MAKLIPVVYDFETYWDEKHSLSKMSPIDYVMSPKTELMSVTVKVGDGPIQFAFGQRAVRKLIQSIDWSDKLAIAHNNSEFDALIMAFRLGVKPKMWGCTLAMARPLHAKDVGGSLAALVKHYGLGVKDNTILLATKGRHCKDITPEEVAAMELYNKADTQQCHDLFYKLYEQTSKDEMQLIDMTIRMFVEPQFVLDIPLLQRTLAEVQEEKRAALAQIAELLGFFGDDASEQVRKVLASAPKFAAFVTSMGVPIPMKPNPKGKMIPALAKTDEGFIALTEHEHPLVAAAAQARLGVKSTLLETRIHAVIKAAEQCSGLLPIPLKYYGADTTGRWSGFLYNPQNFPRLGKEHKPSDALRQSLCAPPGYKIITADLSGIELRVNMFLWKVLYAMELFTANPAKADLYKVMASEVFAKPEGEIVYNERQAGKAMHLGCGFGLRNTDKFRTVARTLAQIDVPLDIADQYILAYRAKHPNVVQGWRACHLALDYIYTHEAHTEGGTIDPWKMCSTTADGIKTPVGTIRYPDLRKENNEETGKEEWVYGHGRKKARIYAGKVTENCVQHLARGIIAQNALTIRRTMGLRPVLMVHDELVYIVPEDQAEAKLADVQQVMRTPPVWWPELAVWSEGGIGNTYAEAH